MSEPYFIPDPDLLSECCGAPPASEVDGEPVPVGLCSDCKEWAGFYSEEEEEED